MFRGTRNFADFAPVWLQRLMMVLVLCLMLLGSVGITIGAAARQQSFPSPEEGVRVLMDAAKNNDTASLLQVLGPEAQPFINTGDAVSDQASRARFVQAYEEAHTFVPAGDTKVILQMGNDAWPFPIPLVKDNTSWRFDSKEGKEEILNRNIGRNELDVIQVCLAYVDAQREYYGLGTGPNGMLQYAQKFLSVPGKHDGLYWPTKAAERPSPLGALVARARAEGYSGRQGADGQPRPFHGYVFRILTAQGPDAPGGAYNYVVRGHMIGGFAMVARPASYGDSGVMTFLVSHDGKVFQKDLGEATPRIVSAMKAFNPDSTWQAADTTLQK